MQYRIVCTLSLLLSACAPTCAYSAQTEAREEAPSYKELYTQAQQQSQNLADWLAYTKHHYTLTDEELTELDDAITTLQLFRETSYTGYSQLINVITENQTRARQLHEVVTSNTLTPHARHVVPHIDTETPLAVLKDMQEATQELINDAIEHLKNTNWQQVLDEAQQLCSDWYLDTAGIAAAGAAGLGCAYYFLAPHESITELYHNPLVQEVGNYTAALGALSTFWVRHRTPDEIASYSPQYFKNVLLAYKNTLKCIGFPGNMIKKPTVYTASDNLPNAETFREHAKAQGYRVEDARIPEDMIDLKIWKVNLLDASLLTFAWNCITKEAERNDLQRLKRMGVSQLQLLKTLVGASQ